MWGIAVWPLLIKAVVGVVVVGGGATVVVSSLSPSSDVAVVTKHVDGDTIDVRVDGADRRVRLLNIDTPETVDPNQDVQCLGPEASAHLAALLPLGTEVTLDYDKKRVDRWGRTLAAVFVGDMLINAEVARAGLGIAEEHDGNDEYLPAVQQAQNEAMQAGRGLYAADVACTLPAKVQAAENALAAAPAMQWTGTPLELDAAAALADVPIGHGTAFLSWANGPRLGMIWAAFGRAQQDGMVGGVAARTESARVTQVAQRTAAADMRQREKAEADRIAAERATAEREARERAAAERAARKPSPPTATRPSAPSQGSGGTRSDSSGGSVGSGDPYPGYTGPRCYLPGGKTYRPC